MKIVDNYLNNLNLPDLEIDTPSTDFIYDVYKNAIEGCLRELLTQYLGRPAQVEDGCRLMIYQYPQEWDRPMGIAIDGKPVGHLKIDNDFNKITATFTPLAGST